MKRITSQNKYLDEKILKQKTDKDNYFSVGLCKNGKVKRFKIHRLVAFMFIINDNPKEKIYINHKDENPSNNLVDNLEWCTPLYNVMYGNCRNKRTETRTINNNLKTIVGIDNENNIKYTIIGLDDCNKYGLNFSHVYECCRNNHNNKKGRKIHKKCRWFYLEDYLKIKGE